MKCRNGSSGNNIRSVLQQAELPCALVSLALGPELQIAIGDRRDALVLLRAELSILHFDIHARGDCEEMGEDSQRRDDKNRRSDSAITSLEAPNSHTLIAFGLDPAAGKSAFGALASAGTVRECVRSAWRWVASLTLGLESSRVQIFDGLDRLVGPGGRIPRAGLRCEVAFVLPPSLLLDICNRFLCR